MSTAVAERDRKRNAGYRAPTQELRSDVLERKQALPYGHTHDYYHRAELVLRGVAGRMLLIKKTVEAHARKEFRSGFAKKFVRELEHSLGWAPNYRKGHSSTGIKKVVAKIEEEPSLAQGPSLEEIWAAARSDAKGIPERLEALSELMSTDASRVADFVASALATPVDTAWHRALVLFTERVKTADQTIRVRLLTGLRAHALLFRDAKDLGADPPLWAALRRYSSLVPTSEVTSLLDFLRSDDRPKTRQTALQGLQNILSTESLPDGAETAALKKRVSELAFKHLDDDLLGSPENAAMALNCYCAAVLADADTVELTNRLLGLARVELIAPAAKRILGRSRDIRNTPSLDWVLEQLSKTSTV